MRKTCAFAAILALGLAAGCGGSSGPTQPAGPQAGRLTVSLSGSGTASAMLVRVKGPSPTAPQVTGGAQKIYSAATGDSLEVVLVGSMSTGAAFTFHVPDVAQAASYTATVLQAAGSDNTLQAAGGYTATVAR